MAGQHGTGGRRRITGTRRKQALWLSVLVAGWQLAVSVGPVSGAVLPTPLAVAANTATAISEAGFQEHVVVTLRRTTVASAVASVVGTPLGLAMGWNSRVKRVLSPVVAAVFPLPTVALLPLLILLLGSKEMAIVFTAVLGATVLVLWNARTGARTIGSVYVDVARDNGATSTYALYREVLLPGAMPLVLVGIRLGLSTSLLIVVAVEFVAGGDGLGYVLWTAWLAYRLADLWAALVAVGTIGVAVTYGLAAIQRFLVPWNAQDRQPAVI